MYIIFYTSVKKDIGILSVFLRLNHMLQKPIYCSVDAAAARTCSVYGGNNLRTVLPLPPLSSPTTMVTRQKIKHNTYITLILHWMSQPQSASLECKLIDV